MMLQESALRLGFQQQGLRSVVWCTKVFGCQYFYNDIVRIGKFRTSRFSGCARDWIHVVVLKSRVRQDPRRNPMI